MEDQEHLLSYEESMEYITKCKDLYLKFINTTSKNITDKQRDLFTKILLWQLVNDLLFEIKFSGIEGAEYTLDQCIKFIKFGFYEGVKKLQQREQRKN